MNPIAIVEAPSPLGLKESGVELLPDALLGAGLADRLQARRAGRVRPPAYNPQREPASRMLNPLGIAAYSAALANAVSAVLDRGEFPLVLGGDCSILLGNLLALRRRGRYGLLFLDAHADFYEPEVNINGEAASSELAFASGRGPAVMTNLEGLSPLVQDDDVVVLGMRDEDEQKRYGSQPLPAAMSVYDLTRMRILGAMAAAERAVVHLTRRELDGFWVHLDADVLDDSIMPAVDYRLPGGLSWEDLGAVLEIALASRRAVGLEVTIFNPKLDPGGAIAERFVTVLSRAMR